MLTITKKELIDRVAENTRTKRLIVKPVVQSFLDEIIRELAKNNRLEFRDFGVFEPRVRAARRRPGCTGRQVQSRPADETENKFS